MKTKVFKNTLAYVLAGMAPYIANFFLLPVFTRYMPAEEYGIVGLLNSFSAFVLCFLGLQLGSSINRFFFDYDEKEVKTFFSTILYSILAINLVVVGGCFLMGDVLPALAFPRADIPYDPYIKIILATVFCSSLVFYFNGMLRVQERGLVLLLSAVVTTVAGVGARLYFVVGQGMGAHGFLLGTLLGVALQLLVLIIAVGRNIVPEFKASLLPGALNYSLPLIPHVLGATLFIYFDKMILGYFVSLASIGLYHVAERFSMLLRLAVNAFNDAISPEFMRRSKQSREKTVQDFEVIITRWAVGVSLLYLGLASFSEELLMLLTAPEYHAAHVFVPILLGAYLFRGLYCFAINAVLFEKKTKAIPLITFLAGGVNIAANLLLIPRFGAIAAAWSTLGAFAVYFLSAYVLSIRYYRIRYNARALVRIFGVMLAILLGVLFLRGDNLVVNILIKTGGLLVFGALLWFWDDGGVVEFVRTFLGKVTSKSE